MTKGIYLTLIITLFSFWSCNENPCTNKAGIEVTKLIEVYSSDRSIPYCSLLKKAIAKDTSSLRSFLKLEILDGAGYDHGGILLELFNYLGEDFIMNSSKNFSKKEVQKIREYLLVGLEYSTNNTSDSLNHVFPKLNGIWNNVN